MLPGKPRDKPQWVTFMQIPGLSQCKDQILLTHYPFLCLLAETLITDITGSYQKDSHQQNWCGTCTHHAVNESLRFALFRELIVACRNFRNRARLDAMSPDEKAQYHARVNAYNQALSPGEYGQVLNNMLVQYSAGKQPTRQTWYRNVATMKKNGNSPTIEQMEMVRTMNQGQVPMTLDEVFGRALHGQKWINARGSPVTCPRV